MRVCKENWMKAIMPAHFSTENNVTRYKAKCMVHYQKRKRNLIKIHWVIVYSNINSNHTLKWTSSIITQYSSFPVYMYLLYTVKLGYRYMKVLETNGFTFLYCGITLIRLGQPSLVTKIFLVCGNKILLVV